jgi:hypothetical protein
MVAGKKFTEFSGISGYSARSKKVSSGRTGLLLSRPLRTVRESFQLTQLKPFERLVERRGNDWSHHLHDTHLEPTHIPLRGLREAAPTVFTVVICFAS